MGGTGLGEAEDTTMITNEDIQMSRQLAGRVVRWHTWPMIRRPTVAEHQNRVTTLYVEVFGMPRAEVLYYCSVHDMGEQTAGDTPYGAKRRVPELAAAVNQAESMGLLSLGIHLPELSEREFRRFKICDLMEMWEMALVEKNMGNTYAAVSMRSCEAAVWQIVKQADEADERIDLTEILNNYFARENC